jgi:excisionase family DNA binding protein
MHKVAGLIPILNKGEMMLKAVEEARRLATYAEASKRLRVSTFTLRRQADLGNIRTINIGARVLIPISEVERIEAEGVGKARPRKSQSRAR